MNGGGYIRTDLAAESPRSDGSYVTEYVKDGFFVHEIRVPGENGGGRYLTVTVGELWLKGRETEEMAKNALSELLSELIDPIIAKKPPSVLTVCLGNRRITSDAIGPLCAERLIVTRHLRTEKAELFTSLGGKELAVITPGVTGETGIETYELILSAVRAVRPSLVICIDALAARSVDRLVTTVQLTDTGISPGSGVGNHRKAITEATLGVPVVSIGVPTVVQSSTLVFDALERAGMTDIEKPLLDVLENEKSFFVTPKNADVAVAAQAELIAGAVNKLFLGFSEL